MLGLMFRDPGDSWRLDYSTKFFKKKDIWRAGNPEHEELPKQEVKTQQHESKQPGEMEPTRSQVKDRLSK